MEILFESCSLPEILRLRLVNRQWNEAAGRAWVVRPLRGKPVEHVRIRSLELTTADKQYFTAPALRWTQTIDVHAPVPIRRPALHKLLRAAPALTTLMLSAANLPSVFFRDDLCGAMPPCWARLERLTLRDASVAVPVIVLLDSAPRLATLELVATGITCRGGERRPASLQRLVLKDAFPETEVDALLQTVTVRDSISVNVATTRMIYAGGERKLTPFGAMLKRLYSVDLSGSYVDRLPMLDSATEIGMSGMRNPHFHAVLHEAINPAIVERVISQRNWTTLAMLQTLDACPNLEQVYLSPSMMDCFPIDFTSPRRERIFTLTQHSIEWHRVAGGPET